MGIPRNATLAEEVYRNIENDNYLNSIYADLLYNYSMKLFSLTAEPKKIDVVSALRYADLLSKSAYTDNAETHKIWAQEMIILLHILFPDDNRVRHFLGSILSTVGNYRGLQSAYGDYSSNDVLDEIYLSYNKKVLSIPGTDDKYFFPAQKYIFDGFEKQCFSYSGPTSMGKSFVVQTYIKQQIEAGIMQNFAILVPTKALINEVRSSIINDLKEKLAEMNYRVVTSAGDIVLKQDHNFIFIMTPERMLHLLITLSELPIDFMFVDEAHKISAKGGRSAFYYKVVDRIMNRDKKPSVVFASPNIPNPEVYLNLIPRIQNTPVNCFASRFAPVCQFKYLIDIESGDIFSHDEHSHRLNTIEKGFKSLELCEIISRVGHGKQNIVYCNSRRKVVDYATEYSRKIDLLNNPELDSLSKDIANEVHTDCFLSELIRKGIAYHVGYLPASIRLRIEKCFEKGLIRTMFCTSTLVEGVNLPADNLFITSYKNGISNMNEVEFRNLVGRVGRIKYNLYGNVFMIAFPDSRTDVSKKYESLLNNEIPPQKLSIDGKLNEKQRQAIVQNLEKGDVEMLDCLESETDEDYTAMRKFSLILMRDIVENHNSTVSRAFSPLLNADNTALICEHFKNDRTSDDITLSYDQWENLTDAIDKGHLAYPTLKNDDNTVDFAALVRFLARLRQIFKWEIYEKQTIGKISESGNPNAVLEWYATVLMQWIRGNGLSSIINSALWYKRKHPEKGIWSGKHQICPYYDDSKEHRNYVMAETLDVIESVILFSLSNYFRKFSLEYKRIKEVDHFDNDWYEFVEYGTTNKNTIFLQQNGFSREVSQYILSHRKYIIEIDGKIKINTDIFTCGDIGTETEAKDIQFNIPELFFTESKDLR